MHCPLNNTVLVVVVEVEVVEKFAAPAAVPLVVLVASVAVVVPAMLVEGLLVTSVVDAGVVETATLVEELLEP